MTSNLRPTRRGVIGWIIGVVGLLISGLGSVIGCALPRRRTGVAFSPSEQEILAAAAARILPSDDGPGAAEADAIAYLSRAVAEFRREAGRRLAEGAREIDRIARAGWGLPFTRLDPPAQDQVLTRVSTRRFFHDLHVLTVEGFLGDPVHGGNRGEAGWRYIGYVPDEPRPGSCGD